MPIFDEELLKKRDELLSKEILPYPYSYPVNYSLTDLRDKSETLLDKDGMAIAGRITASRKQGKKVFFFDVEDFEGHIQVYTKQDELAVKDWETVLLADLGDWVGVTGKLSKTKTGELTIWAKEFVMLGKAVIRVPISKSKGDKTFYQLSDPEILYRQRYIAWITNKESRKTVMLRAKIISEIRRFMEAKGFLEVLTPAIEMVYGGAAARPFETTIHALGDQKAFLRISPELPLKKFIVGGFPRVFTICQNFRNEGIDRTHNPEFTMMEWYEAFSDYNYQMEQFENLVATVVKNVTGSLKINYQGTDLDLTPPWERLTMIGAIQKLGGLDVDKLADAALLQEIQKADPKFEKPQVCTRGILLAALFEAVAEKKIVQPTFIIDHPIEISPLTKKKRGNPALVERFEPFILGTEIGNAYSELTDPVEQYDRLKAQREYDADAIKKDGVPQHPVDLDFITAMGMGMPPTGGVGLGIDRLVMFITNQPTIRDVIPFPLMRMVEEKKAEEQKSE